MASMVPRTPGALRRAHRKLAALAGAAALFALVSYPMSWHEVRESDWSGLGCAFMPDCHPSAGSDADDAPAVRDSGYHHGGPLPMVGLLGVLILGAVAVLRPRSSVGLLAACGALACALASLVITFLATFLAHMLDHSRSLPAEGVFYLSAMALNGLAIALLTVQAVQYVRLRRGAAAPPA